MQLAFAPFMGNFFGFCIVHRTEETFSVYARNILGKFSVSQTAFEFFVYAVIYVEMLTRIFLVVKLLPSCERLRREGKSANCLSIRTCF
jgi:hypothetical protein